MGVGGGQGWIWEDKEVGGGETRGGYGRIKKWVKGEGRGGYGRINKWVEGMAGVDMGG